MYITHRCHYFADARGHAHAWREPHRVGAAMPYMPNAAAAAEPRLGPRAADARKKKTPTLH